MILVEPKNLVRVASSPPFDLELERVFFFPSSRCFRVYFQLFSIALVIFLAQRNGYQDTHRLLDNEPNIEGVQLLYRNAKMANNKKCHAIACLDFVDLISRIGLENVESSMSFAKNISLYRFFLFASYHVFYRGIKMRG